MTLPFPVAVGALVLSGARHHPQLSMPTGSHNRGCGLQGHVLSHSSRFTVSAAAVSTTRTFRSPGGLHDLTNRLPGWRGYVGFPALTALLRLSVSCDVMRVTIMPNSEATVEQNVERVEGIEPSS